MTLARIYLTNKVNGKWEPLIEASQSTEDLIQLDLTNSPELIPGEQIDPDDPCRWLVVQPGSGSGEADRQALILVDQKAIPTCVICQDTTGANSQSQLLASMIEQVTRVTMGWTAEKFQLTAADTAEKLELSLAEELTRLLGGEPNEEAFWAAVDSNLSRRRLRLIFVADVISDELRQMLDFLDLTMTEVKVLALEIKQYQAAGQTALSPRLVGRDEPTSKRPAERPVDWSAKKGSVQQAKPTPPPVKSKKSQKNLSQEQPVKSEPGPAAETPKNGTTDSHGSLDARFSDSKSKTWGEATFFKDLAAHTEEAQVLVAWQIYNWGQKNSSRLVWGGSATRGAYAPVYIQGSHECQLFVVTSNGWVELNLSQYKSHPPFNTLSKMEHFFANLGAIDGVELPSEAMQKRALLPLSLFTVPSRLAMFLKVFEWVIVNLETSTGELETSTAELETTIGELEGTVEKMHTAEKKWSSERNPRVLWPDSDTLPELPEGMGNGNTAGSYESSFDKLLSRKRVELEDDNPEDQM